MNTTNYKPFEPSNLPGTAVYVFYASHGCTAFESHHSAEEALVAAQMRARDLGLPTASARATLARRLPRRDRKSLGL